MPLYLVSNKGAAMAIETVRQGPALGEFVVRMALLISLVALSIDAMLPALSEIGGELGVRRSNDSQLVVSGLFLGLAVGQLIYGPLSDSIGRKPAIYGGLVLFIIGCVLSIASWNFSVMLAGRFLQGLGAAGPRIVTIALVRDRYEGRAMARIMSLVMAVFVIVPAIAPALGQVVLLFAHWRMIFVMLLLLAVVAFVWFGLRQQETLAARLRRPLSPRAIAKGVRETLADRCALGYAVAARLIFGAFIGYLNSARQIFQELFALGEQFPFYFAALALAIGGASYLNARLVIRHGMRRLSWRALQVLSGLSVVYFGVAYALAGQPPLWTLMVWGMAAFFCMGILFGNFNAMAMESLGHIAGVAAAVVGSLTTAISLVLGTWIGQIYDGTVLPLVGGFALLGIAALSVMLRTERGRAAG
jgi:DHA1 family bicyclomycin/chloramphenicol resistance-like MFS transporter